VIKSIWVDQTKMELNLIRPLQLSKSLLLNHRTSTKATFFRQRNQRSKTNKIT